MKESYIYEESVPAYNNEFTHWYYTGRTDKKTVAVMYVEKNGEPFLVSVSVFNREASTEDIALQKDVDALYKANPVGFSGEGRGAKIKKVIEEFLEQDTVKQNDVIVILKQEKQKPSFRIPVPSLN